MTSSDLPTPALQTKNLKTSKKFFEKFFEKFFSALITLSVVGTKTVFLTSQCPLKNKKILSFNHTFSWYQNSFSNKENKINPL